MQPPSNKRRSRRLRKKLHVGEFREYGFEYEIELKVSLSPEQEDVLVDRFLAEVIEARSLALGGGLACGFVAYYGRGSATEADRAAVEEWLRSNLPIDTLRVSELMDDWYPTDESLSTVR